MGRRVFTRDSYTSARVASGLTADGGVKGATRAAEQQAHRTGKLEPLVDPSGFDVIRRSLVRVEKNGDLYEMLVGTSLPVETRVDTTGSMGNNVDVALEVLPDAFESFGEVTEGYDIHICTGIFGDVSDRFPLCRPQFEMTAEKIVNQMTMMVPERQGGDAPEDPDLGIFGAAYLCRHYINRIGLKGYDFTATDAPGRGMVSKDQLIRVYGEKVFEKVQENGFRIREGQLDLEEIWEALLDRAHAFVLQVGNSPGCKMWWEARVGAERIVTLPDTRYMPQVQAVIIGLTEGTLALNDVPEFLSQFNLTEPVIDRIAESVINIPQGAQAALPNYLKRPMKGDFFAGKPDVWTDENIWPVDAEIVMNANLERPVEAPVKEEAQEEDDWL